MSENCRRRGRQSHKCKCSTACLKVGQPVQAFTYQPGRLARPSQKCKEEKHQCRHAESPAEASSSCITPSAKCCCCIRAALQLGASSRGAAQGPRPIPPRRVKQVSDHKSLQPAVMSVHTHMYRGHDQSASMDGPASRASQTGCLDRKGVVSPTRTTCSICRDMTLLTAQPPVDSSHLSDSGALSEFVANGGDETAET